MTAIAPGTLEGRRAIVTGAGRGIGAGIAEALIEAGAAVVLIDREEDGVTEVANRLSSSGQASSAVCDVANRDAVAATVDAAAARMGGIDILVNNAQALRADVPLLETTAEDLQLTLGSGLWGTFNMMQACHPHLASDGGAIVNFGSSAGVLGQKGLGAYAATKEGIRGLSRVAAREWGPTGITVNVVCPASLSPGARAWTDANPEAYQAMLSQRAIARDGDAVEDIGATVVFLAGPGARFITGETIMVNGGLAIRP